MAALGQCRNVLIIKFTTLFTPLWPEMFAHSFSAFFLINHLNNFRTAQNKQPTELFKCRKLFDL